MFWGIILPAIYHFGYNSNIIRMKRSMVPVTGNTTGRHKEQKRLVSWVSVDNAPLPKRHQNKQFIDDSNHKT